MSNYKTKSIEERDPKWIRTLACICRIIHKYYRIVAYYWQNVEGNHLCRHHPRHVNPFTNDSHFYPSKIGRWLHLGLLIKFKEAIWYKKDIEDQRQELNQKPAVLIYFLVLDSFRILFFVFKVDPFNKLKEENWTLVNLSFLSTLPIVNYLLDLTLLFINFMRKVNIVPWETI